MMIYIACVLCGMAAGVVLAWLSRRLQKPVDAPLDVGRSGTERPHEMLDRFGVVIEAAGFSAWEIDPRARKFVWVENRLRTLDAAALTLEEYGDALYRMMHPDDHVEMQAIAQAAMTTGQPGYSYRYRLVRPDGLIRHMQSHVRIVRNSRNEAVRLVGATTDITNEVQTNEMLLRQAEQERQLLDRLNIATQAAGISSWEIDLPGNRFLWIENQIDGIAVPEGVEYSLETFRQRIHPEDQAMFRQRLLEAGELHHDRISYRYRAYADDGRLIHAQVSARLLADDSGKVTRLLGVSWDVTKEVEAAVRLEAQAEHERMLLDRINMSTQAAGISSWEYDLDSQRIVWIENPILALSVGGVENDDRSLIERVHPEDRALVDECIRQAISSRLDRLSCRYRCLGLTRDTDVHVQTHARVLYDENGQARRLHGISWDITKEIAASQQLQQQALQLRDAERRLERASLSSSEGHWELDLRSGQMWMSSSYYALLGYRQSELPALYSHVRKLGHPGDLEAGEAAFRRHIETGELYDVELRIRTGSGDYRWFRLRGTVDHDAEGQPLLMAGSIQDIHQQKLAEDALRLAQRRFERAIHGTQDGLWELEANGAAWCSPRLGELLGYLPGELATDTNLLRLFLHPDDEPVVAAATQAHFQQEAPYDIEIRLCTKAGDYRWYRARARADRDAAGRPLRLSGSLQDVTEARAARDALLSATEAAEAANRAKSEFLANVSHEIRTPMNGIIGMTGLLLDTALDRTQRDYAETIRGSADSLLIVINDILDFSKIEAGKLDIEAIEVELRGTVEDVGGAMAFQAAARNLELIVHVHPQVPNCVIGDPQRLRQCLINLVGNAIKFTRSGEIVIEVSMAGRRDGRVLTQFEVRDTGIGIAPDVLQTLFQPFVQADSSTTRHFGGTGLGLSIVRHLVEMMGGEVGVESELGKGSTFWFVLPLEPAAQTTMLVPVDLTRLGRRVLVVDDHETNRRVLAGQLMHAGYEVSLASGGNEALQMLRQAVGDQHPFEVVLADYRMHDMDGATLGEQIHADPQLSQARVVVLTSLDRHGDLRRFAELGFAGYLTKPIRARELFDCMDRVLSRNASEWHLRSQPIVTRGSLGDNARRYEGHVLLVEDNPVNQKVAVRFLERMGCKVRVADNGAEGVKAWQDGSFDIVLMDLQMPVMDGLTATRRIRELESATGRTTTPIVALTANAMSGQLERCMEAGMSAFLTKPLEIARLHETLDRFGLGSLPETSHAPSSVACDDKAPVDLGRLNELTAGDAEFAHELAETFIASGEQVLQEIRIALASFDRGALARAGHKLKGASANIYAEPLRALAYELETSGTGIDQPRLTELVANLTLEFQRAAQFLNEQAPQPAQKAG